ncbi:bifunctional transcriptional activator/DNA repair enzyme protein Ada, partial [Pseudomonas sp. HMWF005]
MKTLSTPLNIQDDPRWAAVVARDPRADGQFVYAVKTTGIYCRPSSLARLPKPQNVEFFDNAQQAEAAGYRPSKRASKDHSDVAAQHAATVAKACRQIETAENPPRLNELAQTAGLSPFHFHRVFNAATGLTPKGYAAAHRSRRVRER